MRQSLSNVGGPVRRYGDSELSAMLAHAIKGAEGPGADSLTHGFHSYPARMHPAVAHHVLTGLGVDGKTVLDPFCGGGTVLVEAMVAGARAVGVDLNPVALRIAETRTAHRKPDSIRRFLATAERVCAASEERVRGRVPARAPLSREEAAWYSGHVLKELAGLREEIARVEIDEDRWALGTVLSAIVIKFSRQRADTAEQLAEKRIRKGLVTEFFGRKARELARGWEDLAEALPRRVPPVTLLEGDARRLPELLQARLGRAWNADLVLTSPPYGGTYDYALHHARRMPWLGLDPTPLMDGEIGARRNLRVATDVSRWEEELSAVMRAMATSVRGGPIVLLIGDGQIGSRRVAADDQIGRLAPALGLTVVAAASQKREDFHNGDPRREHLILLSGNPQRLISRATAARR